MKPVGNSMHRVAKVAGVFAILVAPAGAAEGDLERLATERARWQAAEHTDYRYAYQRHCECNRDTPPVTVVTVRGGRIERVHHVYHYSDREVPAREGSLDEYWTIDELFGRVERALERDANVRVAYHAELGYPTSLFIDYDPDLVGDEADLRSIELEPL